MYEAVKRYETYVARNKRLEGKGASPSTSQPKATGHTSAYKPQFHKTMAFAATIPEVEDDGSSRPESSPQEEADTYGNESSQEDDEGLYIPSYLEEAIPDDPVLQVKMAMLCEPRRRRPRGASPVINWVTSKGTIGSLREKMGMGPWSQRGLPKTSQLQRGRRQNPSDGPSHVSNKSPKMKRAPYLNLDAFHRFIGPKNLGKVLVDDELVTCLLDNEAQLTFIIPPMLRSGEWTSCPWTIWLKRLVEPSRTSVA